MKSECNESCIFIIFLQFLTDFTNSLFLEDKGTQTCRQVPRGLKQFAERPLAGVGTEEAAPGRIPTILFTGGEGPVGGTARGGKELPRDVLG